MYWDNLFFMQKNIYKLEVRCIAMIYPALTGCKTPTSKLKKHKEV